MANVSARMKVVNLEAGMPRVEEARLRLEHELHLARGKGCMAMKIIHGYGSTGIGGDLRIEIQKYLRQAVQDGMVRAFIPGEDWRISDEQTWALLRLHPEWKRDADLGRSNRGISIVLL